MLHITSGWPLLCCRQKALEMRKVLEAKRATYDKLMRSKPTFSVDGKRLAALATPVLYHVVSLTVLQVLHKMLISYVL